MWCGCARHTHAGQSAGLHCQSCLNRVCLLLLLCLRLAGLWVFMGSPVSTSSLATGALGCRCVYCCVQLYMALGNLSSGPHACTASPFLIKLFPRTFPFLCVFARQPSPTLRRPRPNTALSDTWTESLRLRKGKEVSLSHCSLLPSGWAGWGIACILSGPGQNLSKFPCKLEAHL